MIKLHSGRIILRLLIFCLCMVCLWIAPVSLAADLPAGEFTEADVETCEFEDDLFSANPGNGGTNAPASSRVGTIKLSAKPASLVRPFSPPKVIQS